MRQVVRRTARLVPRVIDQLRLRYEPWSVELHGFPRMLMNHQLVNLQPARVTHTLFEQPPEFSESAAHRHILELQNSRYPTYKGLLLSLFPYVSSRVYPQRPTLAASIADMQRGRVRSACRRCRRQKLKVCFLFFFFASNYRVQVLFS